MNSEQFSPEKEQIDSQASPELKKAKRLGMAGKLLGQGIMRPQKQEQDQFFLQKDDLINLSHSNSNINTSKNHEQGFFLGKIIEQANQIEHRKDVQEKLMLKLSADPYIVFYQDDQNPNYPVRDNEMSFMERFCSENMQGMPSVPTGRCTLFCNLVCWFYFLIFGIVFVGIASNIKQYEINYGKQCDGKEVCRIKFEIHDNIRAPFFIYYQLSEFYQSHSDFAASIVPKQMKGEELTIEEYDKYCKSAEYLSQMFRDDLRISSAGYLFDYTERANPCGTASKFIFNDTFMLIDQNNQPVFINETGIAFNVDIKYKYQRNPNFGFRQWLDVSNEHVMNWFNIQSLPLIRKLWGIVQDDLQKGNYTMHIRNNYDIANFGGEKTLILTSLSSFGSKNYTFGILLIVTSFLQLFSAIFIYCKHLSVDKKYQSDKKVYFDPYTYKEKEKQD